MGRAKLEMDEDALSRCIRDKCGEPVVIARMRGVVDESVYRELCREVRMWLRDHGSVMCAGIDNCYLVTARKILRIFIEPAGENEYVVKAEHYL